MSKLARTLLNVLEAKPGWRITFDFTEHARVLRMHVEMGDEKQDICFMPRAVDYANFCIVSERLEEVERQWEERHPIPESVQVPAI